MTEKILGASIELRCILTGRFKFESELNEPEGKTLCGRKLACWRDSGTGIWRFHEWVFQDPTHAVLTGIEHGFPRVCIACADAAIQGLEELKR